MQASGIESELQRMGVDAKCYVAMRYWHPFTEEALDEMKRDGVNTLVRHRQLTCCLFPTFLPIRVTHKGMVSLVLYTYVSIL